MANRPPGRSPLENLAIQAIPIGDVHRDMLGPTYVEAFILEWESQCVGAAIIYFVRKLGAFC
jgi:hypothetical protein